MRERWLMPLSLILVLIASHLVYTYMQTRATTVSVHEYDANGNFNATQYVKGRVLSEVIETRDEGSATDTHILEIEILGGHFKGRRALFRNVLSVGGFPLLNINAGVGDIVLCRVSGVGEVMNIRNLVMDYNRDGFLVSLLGILLAIVIIVGRTTGIRASITMVINGAIMYGIMLPLLHKGYNPVWTIVLTCALISFQSRLIVAGFGRKTYAAILGTVGGVIIAGLVILFAQNYLRFNGLETANAVDIVESRSAAYLDFAGLLIAGMLIGLLGVSNDAAIEVASAIEEVNEANPNLSIPQLIQSGMNVGTDILGTMANTVVFVYFGFRLLIILVVLGTDIVTATGMELLSTGIIAAEMVRIIAGTFGLVITIPLTAAIAGMFHAYARRRKVYA